MALTRCAVLQVHLSLQLSADPLALGRLLVGVTQLHLHLVEVRLHLLPQPNRLAASPDLRVQADLHGLQGALVAPPGGHLQKFATTSTGGLRPRAFCCCIIWHCGTFEFEKCPEIFTSTL